MKNILLIVTLLLVLGFGSYVFLNNQKTLDNKNVSDLKKTEEIKNITLAEISTHNNRESCWTTINGEVFDVTNFIPEHKGKEKILNACGVDATDLFTGKSTLGRVHSQVAVKLLSGMKIGTLQK